MSGQAYTYSASLPAMVYACLIQLAITAIEAIDTLVASPVLVKQLAINSKIMHTALTTMLSGLNIVVHGDIGSPIFHLRLSESFGNRTDDEKILQEIVDLAARDLVLLTRAKYVVSQETHPCPPSIRVSVSAGFAKREIERACSVIKDSVRRVLRRF